MRKRKSNLTKPPADLICGKLKKKNDRSDKCLCCLFSFIDDFFTIINMISSMRDLFIYGFLSPIEYNNFACVCVCLQKKKISCAYVSMYSTKVY